MGVDLDRNDDEDDDDDETSSSSSENEEDTTSSGGASTQPPIGSMDFGVVRTAEMACVDGTTEQFTYYKQQQQFEHHIEQPHLQQQQPSAAQNFHPSYATDGTSRPSDNQVYADHNMVMLMPQQIQAAPLMVSSIPAGILPHVSAEKQSTPLASHTKGTGQITSSNLNHLL